MSLGTYTFDPENVYTSADIARDLRITPASVRKYVERHAGELPAPLFTLSLPQGRSVTVWTRSAGMSLVQEYAMRRAQR